MIILICFVAAEVCEDVDEPYGAYGLEPDTHVQQTEYREEWEKVGEEQQEITQGSVQQNYEEQRMTAQKQPSSFCLNIGFGKCGGKISCRGVR